ETATFRSVTAARLGPRGGFVDTAGTPGTAWAHPRDGPAVMEQADAPDAASPLMDRANSLRGWTDAIRQRFVALNIAPHGSLDLAGSIAVRHCGPLQAAAVSSAPQTFIRTPRQAGHGEPELL